MNVQDPSLVLVINCGSSSIKFALIESGDGASEQLVSGLAERLGEGNAQLTVKSGGERQRQPIPDGDHRGAMRAILHALQARFPDLETTLAGIGHRVVHGGEAFIHSTVIDDAVLAQIEAVSHLAPLHNPANLLGIRAAQALFPDLPQVAVFDTAFHQSLPRHAYLYPVPYEFYTRLGVRRYGFHGTSHRYVTRQAAHLLGREYGELALISAHLGNGCSAAAVLNGQSVDTTMGLTPLEGLVMGTRSGDVDPSLHEFLANQEGYSLAEITSILNKKSGLLGLSGLSNDMRSLEEAAGAGHEQARIAVEVFCYRLAKQIAALSVALGRLDALIFTGGIGENSVQVRARVIRQLSLLGLRLDEERNAEHGRHSQGRISPDGPTGNSVNQNSGPAALVVPTDEEAMIAQDTLSLVQSARDPMGAAI